MPVQPFRIDVPDDVIADLRDRLRRTRFPNEVAGAGWEQGTELSYLQELVTYWRDAYDWRPHESRLNTFAQYTTEIDDQRLPALPPTRHPTSTRIHFIHARSPEPNALPLLLVHGWPGSIVEFLDVLGPLTDPVAHGGRSRDAFHVVAPSLPGYTFSGPTHPVRLAPAPRRCRVRQAHGRPRLRAVRRPGW